MFTDVSSHDTAAVVVDLKQRDHVSARARTIAADEVQDRYVDAVATPGMAPGRAMNTVGWARVDLGLANVEAAP